MATKKQYTTIEAPHFRKQRGEAKRVQPSRARKAD